jgi:hypothetical protein
MKLIEIQRRFSQLISEKARPWTPEESGIRDVPPVPFERRIRIYHYGFAARIGESLKEDFPVLHKWLGDESFDSLVRPYLEEYPSCYQVLAEVSQHFPDFLQGILQPGDPKFLPDLARVEWALCCAATTDETGPLDLLPLSVLPDYPADQIQLVLNPSLDLFFSEWPVDKLLQKQPSIVFRQTVRLAIYRSHEGVRIDRLRARQWELLQLIRSGASVESVLRWLGSEGTQPASLQKWFATWTERRLLLGVRLR